MQIGNARDDLFQRGHRGLDIVEKMEALLHKAEKTVRAERLHEALHGAKIEDAAEVPEIARTGIEAIPGVVIEQFPALRIGKRDVGIVKERGEVVLREA